MTFDLQGALAKTADQHRMALDWFAAHRGQTLPWSEIQAFSSDRSRLVNQAKGIYKPAYTDYALSIRTIQDGPYPDKDVENRPDGSWVLKYFQENTDLTRRDQEATNRGLMKCMDDGIPIGALIKRKPKPGVEYEVLGLGIVTSWTDGFFTIEGFSDTGEVHDGTTSDAARMRADADTTGGGFDPSDDRDLREKSLAQVARRRGQAGFRTALLRAYSGSCCITGCMSTDVLEAAHITPYKGEHSHHVQNGLLLRSDIHTLFDLGLLAIDDTYQVRLAPRLIQGRDYASLEGIQLSLPGNQEQFPSMEALQRHRAWCEI